MVLGALYAEVERQIMNLDNNMFIPSSEALMALNRAMHLYVSTYYKTFEVNEESRKRLKRMLRPSIITNFYPNTDIVINGYKVINAVLPDDIKYTVLEVVTLQPISLPDDNVINFTAKVYPITLDAVMSNIDNPFKRPHIKKVWRLDVTGGNHHTFIIPNDFNLSRYDITYITVPVFTDITAIVNTPGNSLDDYLNETYQHELIPIVVDLLIAPYKSMLSQNKVEEKEEELQKQQEEETK